MLAPSALHRGDAIASVKVGAAESAAGHFWAILGTRLPDSEDDSIRQLVIAELLRTLAEADAATRSDEAVRLLAISYAISHDPVSLSRLLFDLTDRLEPPEMARLSGILMAACSPREQSYTLGFFSKTRAEHLVSGLGADEAWRRATAQTVAFLDIILQRDPTLDLLRMERLTRNTQIERHSAAIADIRLSTPEMMRNKILRECCFFHLRHAKHPETRKLIDPFLDEPPTPSQNLAARYEMMVALTAIEESVRIAELLKDSHPHFGIVRPLKQMADNRDLAPLASFGRAPRGRHLIYLSLVSWGARYIEMTALTGLPSLLSPRNLPQLAKDNDLVVEFFTNASNLEQILAIPALSKLAEIAQIRIFGFPPEIEPLQNKLPYVPFGYGSHATIFRAQRDGADLIFLLSDVVWADGSFGTIADLVTQEKRVVLTDGLNARAADVLPALDAYRTPDGSSLTISARDLWALAGPALMPRTRDHLYDPHTSNSRAMPVRVAFQEAETLTVHGFHKLPFYVSHAAFKDIKFFQYTTPDGAFTESIFDNIEPSQAIYFEQYDTILAVELSDEIGAVSEEVEVELIEGITAYFRNRYFSERLYWNFELGVRYPLVPQPGSPIVNAEDKTACLSRIRTLFATHPIFVDWSAERDRIRRLEFGDGATQWRLSPTPEANR